MATIISQSPAETLEAGRELAGRLRAGEVVALCGELGAGKTHFVKGLALRLGLDGEVSSPTFTLIHEYTHAGRAPLYHLDLYRLESEEDVLRIGIDEYLNSDGVTVIEWADKFPALLPAGAVWVTIRLTGETTREIEISDAPA